MRYRVIMPEPTIVSTAPYNSLAGVNLILLSCRVCLHFGRTVNNTAVWRVAAGSRNIKSDRFAVK